MKTGPHRNGPFSTPCSQHAPQLENTTPVPLKRQTLHPTPGSWGLASSLLLPALCPSPAPSGGSTELSEWGAVLFLYNLNQIIFAGNFIVFLFCLLYVHFLLCNTHCLYSKYSYYVHASKTVKWGYRIFLRDESLTVVDCVPISHVLYVFCKCFGFPQ